MANKLRNKTARVSFFAFQDMITAVTGVLMVVMLMLSLDLTRQASSSSAVARTQVRRAVEQARQQLETRQTTLEQLQLQLSARTNRLFVIPEPDRSGKEVVLVVLSATNGWVSRLGPNPPREFTVDHGRTSFKQVLDTCNPVTDRLVFYVRPSGVGHFEVCRELARRRNFSLGYDAAEEDLQYLLTSP
jgi:hypothetical protein